MYYLALVVNYRFENFVVQCWLCKSQFQ